MASRAAVEADVKVEECDLAGGKAIISKAPDQRQKRPGEDVAPLPYDAPPRQKRVKWVEEDGKEQDEGEGEERLWKFVRHAHAFIAKKASDGRAPSAVLGLGADVEGQLNEDNAKDTGDEESIAAKDNPKLESLPDPQEVIELLVQAKGDADVLVDVITQATDNSWLRLQHVDITGQQQALRLRGAALRVQGRIAQCESLAATLKAGAAALATFAGQDDAFYTDLARLQRNWRVQLVQAIGGSHAGRWQKQGVFRVDVSLARQAPLVDILKDESGRLYIEAEVTGNLAEPGSHARGPGEKIVRRLRGARAVHRELSALQERYWWQDLEEALTLEASVATDLAPACVRQMLHILQSPASSPSALAFRAVVEGAALQQLMPRSPDAMAPTPLQKPPAPSGSRSHSSRRRGAEESSQRGRWSWRYESAASARLGAAVRWLRHRRAQAKVRERLEAAVMAAPPGTLRLSWIPSNSSCVSCLAVHSSDGKQLMLVLDGEELQLEGVLGRRCTLPVAEACVQRLADPGFEAPCLAAALTETGAESREGDTQLLFTSRQMEELEALEQHGGILKSDALLPAGPTRALLPPDPPHPAREGAFPVSKVATPALAALLVGATPPLQMEAEAHARALAGEAELKGGSLLPRGTSPLGLMAFTPPVGPDSEPVKAETPQWEEGKAAEGAVSTDNHLQPVRIEEGQAHQPQHSDGLVKHEFQQPGLLGGNELNQMPLKIADERPVADGQQQQHAATEVTPQGGGGLWPGGDSVSPAGTGGAEPPAEPQAIPSGPSVSLQDPQIPVGGFSASLEDIGGWESAPASVQAADSCVAGGQQRHEGVGDAPRLDPASARGDLDPLEIQMSVGEAMFHDMLNML